MFGAALLSDEKAAGTYKNQDFIKDCSLKCTRLIYLLLSLCFYFVGAVTKAVTAPCWQLEEFVVAKECSACEGLQLVRPGYTHTHTQLFKRLIFFYKKGIVC